MVAMMGSALPVRRAGLVAVAPGLSEVSTPVNRLRISALGPSPTCRRQLPVGAAGRRR